jgi:hypothetical protein
MELGRSWWKKARKYASGRTEDNPLKVSDQRQSFLFWATIKIPVFSPAG